MNRHDNRNHNNEEDFRVRIPTTLTIKDVIFIVGIVVSGAWGFFALTERTNHINAQLDVLEEKVNDIQVEIKDIKRFGDILDDELDDRLDELESESNNNTNRVDEHEKYWHPTQSHPHP